MLWIILSLLIVFVFAIIIDGKIVKLLTKEEQDEYKKIIVKKGTKLIPFLIALFLVYAALIKLTQLSPIIISLIFIIILIGALMFNAMKSSNKLKEANFNRNFINKYIIRNLICYTLYGITLIYFTFYIFDFFNRS